MHTSAATSARSATTARHPQIPRGRHLQNASTTTTTALVRILLFTLVGHCSCLLLCRRPFLFSVVVRFFFFFRLLFFVFSLLRSLFFLPSLCTSTLFSPSNVLSSVLSSFFLTPSFLFPSALRSNAESSAHTTASNRHTVASNVAAHSMPSGRQHTHHPHTGNAKQKPLPRMKEISQPEFDALPRCAAALLLSLSLSLSLALSLSLSLLLARSRSLSFCVRVSFPRKLSAFFYLHLFLLPFSRSL